MFIDLNQSRILLLGATGGIGRSLATSLSELGANLVLTARTSEDQTSLQQEFKCEVLICDMNNQEQVDLLADTIEPLNGVCIVSGIVKIVPPKLLVKKNIEPQVTTNLISPLALVGALLKKNKVLQGGSIIFTSASSRLNQAPCTAPYAGAKLGLIGSARSLAADLSEKKIRVNCVSFDYVDTQMIKAVKADDSGIIGISPVQYTSLPYLFLLSSRSRWITGQLIAADAGRMLGKVRYA